MNDFIISVLMVYLLIAAILGLIPASIAKSKGYDFGLWWLYGWLLFIIAFIHAIVISNKNVSQTTYPQNGMTPDYPQSNQLSTQSIADELKKYRELCDEGVLTEAEFVAKKEQLLKLL